MPLEKIIEHIGEEFSLEIDKIKKETQDRVSKILKEARGKAASIKGEVLKAASFEAQRRRDRILTTANLEARRVVLKEKECLIEEAYKRALTKIKKLGKKSYQDIIKKMLLKTAKSGPGEVIISKEDRKRITPSFIKNINKELKISKDERKISGGFILKRKKIEINNSFESLLRSKREELELRLVRILFGRGDSKGY
jgi:V/A-type H+-transporting ATPase subunit E